MFRDADEALRLRVEALHAAVAVQGARARSAEVECLRLRGEAALLRIEIEDRRPLGAARSLASGIVLVTSMAILLLSLAGAAAGQVFLSR